MFDKKFEELIGSLGTYGVPSVFLIFIVLIVQQPERAEKLKLLIVTPFFKLFKWFGRAYVKHTLSTKLNKFFEKSVSEISNCGKKRDVKFTIDLVKDKNDIIKKNGQLIIRFTESDDQSQNLLTAAKIALPEVVCPYIRANIDQYVSSAIDLTFLKKFADNIDNHAKLIFKKHFLDPAIHEDPRVAELIQDLILIDKNGFFVSIFINELNYIGEGIYAESDQLNRTDEVINFLKYLIDIATRELRSTNELAYHSSVFAVGIILLAITQRAETQGTLPYIKRLQKNFYEGCKSVYVVSYPKSWDFFSRLLDSIEKDNRFNKPNIYKLSEKSKTNDYKSLKIALIRFNQLFFDTNLESHLINTGVAVGAKIRGKVIDVSIDSSLISFDSLTGFLKRNEADWNTCLDCNSLFSIGEEYEFLVKQIDMSTGNIELTRKFIEDDPWKKIDIPNEGDTVSVIPTTKTSLYLCCMLGGFLEAKLPISEISWAEVSETDLDELIGKFIDVKVVLVDKNTRTIRVSKRAIEENPWTAFKLRYPEGTVRTGEVKKISGDLVVVEIDPGIFGNIPSNSFHLAGYEYRNFQGNLVIGQKLEVVVTKVWEGKQKISLELKRNYDKMYPQRVAKSKT